MSAAKAIHFLIDRYWVGTPLGGGRSLTGVWGSRPHVAKRDSSRTWAGRLAAKGARSVPEAARSAA